MKTGSAEGRTSPASTPRLLLRLPVIETARRRHLPTGFPAMEKILGGLALGELCMVASKDAAGVSEICRTIARATYDAEFQVLHDPGTRAPGRREQDYIRIHIAGAPTDEVLRGITDWRRAEPGARLVVLEGFGRLRGRADRNVETLKRFVREEELVAVVSVHERPVAPSHPSDVYVTVSPEVEDGFRKVRVMHPRRDVVFAFSLDSGAVLIE